MISFWQVVILIAVVALAILAGVLSGAYSVYRTKREPHEPFLGKPPEGEVFSIDNWGEDLTDDAQEMPEQPETIQSRNTEFVDQFAAQVGGGDR